MAPEKRFRIFATTALAGAASGVALLVVVDGVPPLGSLLLFMGLLLFGGHRAVELSSDIELSPAFMILVAAVVAFAGNGSYVEPVLLAAAVTLRFDLLRHPSFRVQACFNAANLAVATLLAALVYSAAPTHNYVMGVTWAAVASVVLNSATVGGLALAFAIEGHARTRRQLWQVWAPVCVQSLPFALLGYAIGKLYVDLGAIVMVLIVVPIFIAQEMFGAYLRIKQSHDETVQMLIRALETKDRYTAGHSERVAKYAEYMGGEFHFGPRRMERLRFAALMHDIGKLVVPNHILNKPGKLTEEEFAKVRLHEKVSVQMLSHIDFLRPVAAQTDSEQMRLNADDPDHPIEPYIIMIADAYDAMTSTRSYRKALPQEVAFQELRDKAGTQFHPECVEALIHALERRGEFHGDGHEEESEFENAPVAGLGSAGLGDLLTSDT